MGADVKRISNRAFIMGLAVGLSLLPSASTHSQELRNLPRMRAIPIGTSSRPEASPDALQSPPYCDTETLRDSATLRAIHFGPGAFGIAVGDHGAILQSLDSGATWKTRPSSVGCMLMDAIVLNERYAVVVGGGFDSVTGISRGAVLISSDSGQSWRRGNDTELPRLDSIQVERIGGKTVLIAAGDQDPVTGANQFRSRDGGRSWDPMLGDEANARVSGRQAIDPSRAASLTRATEHHAPLRASCKLSDGTWLMAGDHGHILRSVDQGESWQAAREAKATTSVLFIAAQPSRLPWSLIGREALEQRMRSSVLVGTPHNVLPESARQAAMRLGAASLDSFDNGVDTEQSLLDWIDVHRPPVLAIDASLPKTLRSNLLAHAVDLGTQKVIEYSNERRGESVLHRGALLPDSGTLAGDFEFDAWMLIGEDLRAAFDVSRQQWSTKTRYHSGGSQALGGMLATGVRLSQAHQLPPRTDKASRRLLQITQARLKQQAAIGKLLDDAPDENRVRESIHQMIRQTDRPDRFRSACMIVARSHGTLVEEITWQDFAQRFPTSSAGALAALRNKARSASREWTQIEQRFATEESVRDDAMQTDLDGLLLPVAQASQTAILSPFQSPEESPVVQASASLPISPTASSAKPESNAQSNGDIDLAWQMHPVRLIVADSIERNAAQAQSGESVTAEPENADLRRIAARDGDWSSLLRDRSPQVVRAKRVESRPLLNGKLDETFWPPPAQTLSVNPIKVRVAFDSEFVYFAVETPAESFTGSTDQPTTIGTRDADLDSSDRVLLQIDIDRDLFTSYELQLTRDGRTHDSVDGRGPWDPTWYVASNQTDSTVVTELAIARDNLSSEIRPGDRWFVRVNSVPAGKDITRPWMPRPTHRIRIDF